jgi:polysaccharide deacetylase 2 family uncharacterized protein YibQ
MTILNRVFFLSTFLSVCGGALFAQDQLPIQSSSTTSGAKTEGQEFSAPEIAVVIDDFGLTLKTNPPDEKWMAITWPITFADMPDSPRTAEAARQTKAAGHELIIHFPFDPFLKLDLNKDAASLSDIDKVRKFWERAQKQVPGAVGVNNHRSLRGTQNRPLMDVFMQMVKPTGFYFIDSHVSSTTVAYYAAQAAGVRSAKNYTFLEDEGPGHHKKAFAIQMLRRAAAYAKKHGKVLVIGHHYFYGTYEALTEEVPKLQAEGFRFVFASEVVH